MDQKRQEKLSNVLTNVESNVLTNVESNVLTSVQSNVLRNVQSSHVRSVSNCSTSVSKTQDISLVSQSSRKIDSKTGQMCRFANTEISGGIFNISVKYFEFSTTQKSMS